MIKVQDSGEPLVNVLDLVPTVQNGLKSSRRKFGQDILLREKVAKMLQVAEKSLPQGIHLLIVDAWRPFEAQEAYFSFYTKRFKTKNPSWNTKQVEERAGEFAINPYTDLHRAGHLTGGAVDVFLAQNGRRLPMKADSLSGVGSTSIDATSLSKQVRQNRSILKKAMTTAGFANYPLEYWHWSYGDVIWAEQTGQKIAIYGPTTRLSDNHLESK